MKKSWQGILAIAVMGYLAWGLGWAEAGPASGHEVAPSEIRDLLTALAQRRAQSPGYRIRFVEEKTSPLFREPLRAEGEMFFSPPNRFRRDTLLPAASSVRSDGTTLWMVYPEFREVEEYPLQGLLPMAGELRLLVAGLKIEDLPQHFRLRAWREPDGRVTLELRPRGGRHQVQEMRLGFGADQRLNLVAWTGRDGSATKLRLSDERPHQAAEDFFQPPRGEGWHLRRPFSRE